MSLLYHAYHGHNSSARQSLQLEHAPTPPSAPYISDFVVYFAVLMQCEEGIQSMRQWLGGSTNRWGPFFPSNGTKTYRNSSRTRRNCNSYIILWRRLWPVVVRANKRNLLSTISESNCENQGKLKCVPNCRSLSVSRIRNRLNRNVSNIYLLYTNNFISDVTSIDEFYPMWVWLCESWGFLRAKT